MPPFEDLRATRRAALALAGAALGAALPGAARAAEPVGRVADIVGVGWARAGDGRRPLDRAAPVALHEEAGTGADSRLVLRLGEATTLRLGENARVVIDSFLVNAGGEISLNAGPLLVDKQEGSAGSVRIRSAYGLIAVRGTRVFAGPSNGVFGVLVQRGHVTVTGGGRSVRLVAGEGTDIARPGAAPTPPRAWGDARIAAALASVR